MAEARRAGSEERLWTARASHDVVAHTMSVIAVQAGVANRVATERPDEARRLSTAKTRVGRLLKNLGARDRAQLVIAAYDARLVRPATQLERLPPVPSELALIPCLPPDRLQ
ncbi:histidine kinase [Streptomyces sp. NPDC001728]|uniref:histidine kinase n=1 Tax=Streptomyces sp. NPDC001728 TaxID=3154396 RepID=UPI00331CAEA8